MECCSQSCKFQKVKWVIKYYLYYNSILVRTCTCEHKILSGKIYTEVPTEGVSGIVSIFLALFLLASYFFFRENVGVFF